MCWPEELFTKRSLHRCYKPLTNGQRDSELASLTVLAIVVDIYHYDNGISASFSLYPSGLQLLQCRPPQEAHRLLIREAKA